MFSGPFLVQSFSCGAPTGTRTPNPLIKSQLLCQLSYWRAKGDISTGRAWDRNRFPATIVGPAPEPQPR